MKVMADNMNLQIKNVHIRIEDLWVSKVQNFAFGMCIDSVSFGKTNAQFDPTVFITDEQKLKEMWTFSLLSMNGFAAYWIPFCRTDPDRDPFMRPDSIWTENNIFKSLDNFEFVEGSQNYIQWLKLG